MNVFLAAVSAHALVLALALLVALAAPPGRGRNLLAGGACLLLAGSGTVAGWVALTGAQGRISVPTPLAGLDLTLVPTPLGGLFTLVAGGVGVVCALYAIGYVQGASASRTSWSAFAVFIAGMMVVPLAADVVTFLVAWEVMAIGSTVLVFTEHQARASVRPAGLWYAVMTHLSFLLLAAGLGVLAAASSSTSFADIAAARSSGGLVSIGFVLAVLGFATKAGAVPLHVWLPRAHPEAPSHVSALMSAAMVKMGIYGILLLTRLLPSGPGWWALVVLGLGLPSALYGILQASVTSDLKRLLAYSTTENVGLILIAIAVAMLTPTRPGIAATALLAALLLTISHAAFKTALFLSAGSVLHGTGERDLDRMGGLALRMPVTTGVLAVGCLGAAALPVTSGFVAEWTLLHALIHADAHTDRLTTAVLPLVMGVVALTAGLALLTFTKAFGIASLARPRSPGAATAHEASPSMRVAMVVASLGVLAIGLLPGQLIRVLTTILPPGTARATGSGGLALPGADAALDPTAIIAFAVALTLPMVLTAYRLARRAPRQRSPLGWGCGGVRTSSRMQYTATSYAEPLTRVFADALAPTRDVTVTHVEESRHALQSMAYQQQLVDVVESRGYVRVVLLLDRVGDWGRTVQNGNIHRYLAFSFAALVVVLIGVLQ